MFSLEAKPGSSEDRQSRSRSRASCDATGRHAAARERLKDRAGDRPARLELGEAGVDVWHCYLDALGDDYAGLLSSLDAQEIERYRGFSSEAAARQFLAGRALARAALSCYANVPPRLWSFAANEHGRPAIDEPRAHRGLCFNLSHTSGAAVLAIGRVPEVGIDVETTDRPVDIEWIGRSVFTQSERGWLTAGGSGSERDRFFDLWTLKEAYIKARGRGFSLRPGQPRAGQFGRPFPAAVLARLRSEPGAVAVPPVEPTSEPEGGAGNRQPRPHAHQDADVLPGHEGRCPRPCL